MQKLIFFFIIALSFGQSAFAQSPTDFFKVAEWVDSSLEEFSVKLKEQFPNVMFKDKGYLGMLPEMVDDPYYWYLEGTISFPQTGFSSIKFVCVRLGKMTHEFIIKRFGISGPGHVRNARIFVPVTWSYFTLSGSGPFQWPNDAISRLVCESSAVEAGSGGLVPLREDVLSSMESLFDEVVEKTRTIFYPYYILGNHEYNFFVFLPTYKEHIILHEAEATNFKDSYMFFRSYALFQGI